MLATEPDRELGIEGYKNPSWAKALVEMIRKTLEHIDKKRAALVLAVILAVIGGLCAFLLRSHVPDTEAVADGAPSADVDPTAGAIAQTGDA